MPRPRGSEMPQRQSPRGPLQLRTSSSDSDSSHSHHRPIPDRSPKLGDRRSPRDTQPGSVNQKKLGTRIADLESQLGQAQVELKNLKTQLASAEAAKKEAQDELKKKTKKKVGPEAAADIREKSHAKEVQGSNKNRRSSPPSDVPEEIQQETDVFEVPVEKVAIEPQVEVSQTETDETEKEAKSIELKAEEPVFSDPEKQPIQDHLALKDDEINSLKSKLEGKEKELEVAGQENESLKQQLSEATADISSGRAKEGEMALKLKQLEEELKASKENNTELKEKLEAAEGAKEELETEMKKLRVQTEQWRKAADAAAAVLAGGVERIPDRCGSMDKHFRGLFEVPHGVGGGYPGFVGSPGGNTDYMDDGGFGGGARRKGSSGIKMFGDLWKKKGQK